MVPVPSGVCANYARTVSAALPSLQNAAVWLRVPLVCHDAEATQADGKAGHEVRSLCWALLQRPAGLVNVVIVVWNTWETCPPGIMTALTRFAGR